MNEIINMALVAMEEGSTLDPKSVMDTLRMLQFKHHVSFDYDRMLVLCDISDGIASQKVWEAAGRRFPLTFPFDKESVGGQAVQELYQSLSPRDREDVDLIPAKSGCRTSLYVRRERADLIARFWAAMFTPNVTQEEARLRGGRDRETERITVKVPDDLVLRAAKKGRGFDRVFYLDGSIYVTEEMLRQLQREHEEEHLRDHVRKARQTWIGRSSR